MYKFNIKIGIVSDLSKGHTGLNSGFVSIFIIQNNTTNGIWFLNLYFNKIISMLFNVMTFLTNANLQRFQNNFCVSTKRKYFAGKEN